jgi:hypothetical protein
MMKFERKMNRHYCFKEILLRMIIISKLKMSKALECELIKLTRTIIFTLFIFVIYLIKKILRE